MYFRLKNSLDADCFIHTFWNDEAHKMLADRLHEIVEMLDEAYGGYRSSVAMGGYVLVFMDAESYKNEIGKIEDYYHINPTHYEYRDVIGEQVQPDGKLYKEDLYLLSSDDSLVCIYPEEVKKYA